MAHSTTGWHETAREVLRTLSAVRDLGTQGTLAWLISLGAAVHTRPASMKLSDLRAELTKQNNGVAPDGSSAGNLSKAATAYRALLHDTDLDPTALARYRQRDLYAAACAVEAGTLDIDNVLEALANGLPDEAKAPTTPKARARGTDPEPTPTTEPDPLMQAVFEAATLGADAAGMDVLTWVQQQAAKAMLA
jgi:hypothetical protein